MCERERYCVLHLCVGERVRESESERSHGVEDLAQVFLVRCSVGG